MFEPLRHRSSRRLASARTAGWLGETIAPIALAFAVLDLTGSVSDLGIVVGARSIAHVALLLMGGVLADRLPRAVLLQGASVAAAVTEGVLAASVLLGFASVPHLASVGVLNGAVAAGSTRVDRARPSRLVGPSRTNICHSRDRVEVGIHMQHGEAPCLRCRGHEQVDNRRALVQAPADQLVLRLLHEPPTGVRHRVPGEERLELAAEQIMIGLAGHRAGQFRLDDGTDAYQSGLDGVQPPRLNVTGSPQSDDRRRVGEVCHAG